MTKIRHNAFSRILCGFLTTCSKLGFIKRIKTTKYHTTAYLSDDITFRQYHPRKV